MFVRADQKVDRDLGVKCLPPIAGEVLGDQKPEPVGSLLQRSSLGERGDPPVRVRYCRRKYLGIALERHLDPVGRKAQRRVQYVGADRAHAASPCPSNFANRNRVILRCSSAATESSVFGSFLSRFVMS